MDEDQGQAGAKLSAGEPETAEVSPGDVAAEAASDETPERTPEQVRAEIEETREQLGDTVEALAAKTDVKGQAKRAAGNARATVADTAAGLKQSAADRKDDIVSGAHEAAPESAHDAAARVVELVRGNRATLIPAAALVLGVLIGRRRSG